jgi:hypothetical protein
MSVEIIKTYKQEVPALRFIGKKYGDKDRVDGMFGKYWDEWHQNGWFDVIKKQFDGDLKTLYDDGDACIGLMRWKEGDLFEYWIGYFMPLGTNVPEGFISHDFPKATLSVCWVSGQGGEVYMQESKCAEKLGAEGYKVITDGNGAYWFFERYVEPRFMADEKGNSVLDICHYIESVYKVKKSG